MMLDNSSLLFALVFDSPWVGNPDRRRLFYNSLARESFLCDEKHISEQSLFSVLDGFEGFGAPFFDDHAAVCARRRAAASLLDKDASAVRNLRDGLTC
jgi:hypothetical protein